MNSRSATGYSTIQKLHPLSLLAQLISRQVSGHFKLSVDAITWSLFLDQGKLTYATSTDGAFERLDKYLRRLAAEIPSLVSAVRVQVRLLFEQATTSVDSASLAETTDVAVSPDYQAICWLVEQDHLTPEQAADLIAELAVDVIEPFLGVQEGHYELVEAASLDHYSTFCRLDLRPIVETCQKRRRERMVPQSSGAFVGASGMSVAGTAVKPAPNEDQEPSGAGSNGLNGNEQNSKDQSIGGNGYPPAVKRETLATLSTSASLNGQQIPPYDPALHFRPASRLPTGSSQARPQVQPATHTIACIDDSPTVLNAMQEFLDDKSLTVILINDPVKALMQIMRSKPDLILLDVTMPNLDGYELCSLLRRHPHFKNTPIVMVTGNTGLIDRAKAKLVRASGYLTKPFSQSDLLKIVFMHLPALETR